MKKYTIGLAVAVLSLPALGGAAYALTQSVDDGPAPQVILPTGSTRAVDDNGGDRPAGVSDDPPGDDNGGDDNGGDRPANGPTRRRSGGPAVGDGGGG